MSFVMNAKTPQRFLSVMEYHIKSNPHIIKITYSKRRAEWCSISVLVLGISSNEWACFNHSCFLSIQSTVILIVIDQLADRLFDYCVNGWTNEEGIYKEKLNTNQLAERYIWLSTNKLEDRYISIYTIIR